MGTTVGVHPSATTYARPAIMKPSLTIPIAIVVAGILMAVAVYIAVPKKKSPSTEGGMHATLVRPVTAADHILGNPAAKVMIVEYSDFDCSYCKTFNDTLHQIIVNDGTRGQVAWVFREFPLTEIHPNALKQAEAAECAASVAGNIAFWNFEDTLFSNQPVDPTRYGTYAQSIGIDTDAFATCVANAGETVDARIKTDRQNALNMGAEGTPYSVILVSGQPPIVMNGGYSYAAAKQLVDQAVASAYGTSR